MSEYRILHGDVIDKLRELPDTSIDSVVTDPPYHLTTGKKGGTGEASVNLESPYGRARVTTGFMGKQWDGGDIAFRPETWREVMRVLKPGGYLLAFGGTRTYHRLVCAIEDGGFQIRDQIGWVFGSGFPKSLNLHGEWEGWGTALKPAWEPIVVARKELVGTVKNNVLKYGTGAMNIDGCRVEAPDGLTPGGSCLGNSALHMNKDAGIMEDRQRSPQHDAGRWPANLIHDGSDEVVACFPAEAGAAAPVTVRNGDKFRNTFGVFAGNIDEQGSTFHGDSGSAARFFYCAKASREDRNEGCEEFVKKSLLWSSGEQNPGSFQSKGTDRTSQNNHPTVKPTDLMRYLCRLVTPPGGTVLDCFMGSGSTGKSALYEGFKFIGIDEDVDYCAIAKARMDFVIENDSPLLRAIESDQ